MSTPLTPERLADERIAFEAWVRGRHGVETLWTPTTTPDGAPGDPIPLDDWKKDYWTAWCARARAAIAEQDALRAIIADLEAQIAVYQKHPETHLPYKDMHAAAVARAEAAEQERALVAEKLRHNEVMSAHLASEQAPPKGGTL